MKKNVLIICALFVFIFALSGCEAKESDVVEITFIHGWGSTEPDHVSMRNIYKDFEKENPDIRINMLSMPTNGEMIRKVEDMIASGNIPDVVFTASEGTDSIYRFMKDNNMLLDIMPYAKKDRQLYDSISPITIESWAEEGRLYTASDVLILSGGYWYNKEILEKVGINDLPRTWNEFYEMLTKIDEWSDNNGEDIISILPSMDAYLYMADEILYEENELPDENITALSEKGVSRVIDCWREVFSHTSGPSNYSYRDEIEQFNAGKLAVFVNGVWGASMINEDIRVGYKLLPSDMGKAISCQTASLGYLLGNTNDEKRNEASIKFLKYMLSENVQKRILLETQQMPSNPNINISDYYSELERFCLAVETVQQADVRVDIPQITWSESKREEMERLLPYILSGEGRLEDLVKRLNISE